MDGQEATDLAKSYKPDLIILDIMMPKKSGVDVCREIRATSRTPIIMLTAKGEEIDRILGLELGADDYIVKPFSAREVVARVKAVLRRFSAAKEEPEKVLRFPGLEINISNYDVRIQGEPVQFTPKEVEILIQAGAGVRPGADAFPGMGVRLFRGHPGGGYPDQAHPAEAAPGRRELGHPDGLWSRI